MRKGLSSRGAALVAAALLALPVARPLTVALPVAGIAAFVGTAEAQRRSGGYSRPSYSGSRTPSIGSSRSYAPRAPSTSSGSGGYARPSSRAPSVIPGFGGSASDRGYAREGSGDALRRFRERDAPITKPTQAPPAPGGPLGVPGGFGLPGGFGAPRPTVPSSGSWGGGWRPNPARDDYVRRGGGFGFPGGGVPGGVLAGPRGFGVWDAAFLWFMLSNLNRPGSTDFFHNHRNDPAIQDFRRQAEQQAGTDPEIRRQLDQLDGTLTQRRNDPVDPSYLPPDATPEVATARPEDRRTPSAAEPESGGGLGFILPLGLLVAGGGIVFLIARRRLASREGSVVKGPVGTAADMIRDRVTGAEPRGAGRRYRIGMTVTLDPTPFLLAGEALRVPAPREATQSVTEVGRIGGEGPSGMVRLYLADGAFVQVALGTDAAAEEARYFAPLDEVTPANEDEWGAWLDPREGMIGYREFETKDGAVHARVWQPGPEMVPPREMTETIEGPSGSRTVTRRSMLYASPTHAAAPAPEAEFVLVEMTEDGGNAWVTIHGGIALSPASLSIV